MLGTSEHLQTRNADDGRDNDRELCQIRQRKDV
jgi:hypothetical protein